MQMNCNKELIPKNRNYRVTPQRKLILQELRSVCSHPTARELYDMVHKKDPHINLTTVYRTLDFLEKQNLVLRLQSKDRETRYDGKCHNHCHLCCTECGSIQDVCDVSDVSIQSREISQSGFQVQFECLEFHGVCQKCLSER
jgi:Fur family ferric uptake transcriptional regulator